jgi:predicted kinase
MKKTVYILKGVSGSGKSSLAEELVKGRQGIICCADDYLYNVDGVYDFTLANGGQNHKLCQEKFLDALEDWTVNVIVVANTNVEPKHWNFYVDAASRYNATIFHLVVENRHGGKDSHSVPEHVLASQEQRIKNSLKLR